MLGDLGSQPDRRRRAVLLPAPLGPRKPRISPGETVKETPFRAAMPLKRLTRFSARIMEEGEDSVQNSCRGYWHLPMPAVPQIGRAHV